MRHKCRYNDLKFFPVQDRNSSAVPSLLFAFVAAVAGIASVACDADHAFALMELCSLRVSILVKMNHVILPDCVILLIVTP